MARPFDARRQAENEAALAVVAGPVVGFAAGVLASGYDLAAVTFPIGAVVGVAVAYALERRASRLPRPYPRYRRIV